MALIGSTSLRRSYVRISLPGICVLSVDEVAETWKVPSDAVAELVGIEGGVVSGVINLESSGVEASDWRPRHDEQYNEA